MILLPKWNCLFVYITPFIRYANKLIEIKIEFLAKQNKVGMST